MQNHGWRTIIIERKCDISFKDDNIVFKYDNEQLKDKMIPISQIQSIEFNTNNLKISTRAIEMLTANNVKLVFCNSKHMPIGEIVPYSGNSMATGKLYEQINWNENLKDTIWQKIVRIKIMCQASIVERIEEGAGRKLIEYADDVAPSDATNGEGQAARVYFNRLFGKDFERRAENNVNAALNYGYSILLSTINRLVVAYGYNMSLGIKHKSQRNPFNLSCDLMEPFRPIIDSYVYENRDRSLSFDYKKELIDLMYKNVKYGGKNMQLVNAIEEFIIDFFSEMKGLGRSMKEVYLAA